MDKYTTDATEQQPRFHPETWQRVLVKLEFDQQPPARQRDTLDRILLTLVLEYRREQAHHSALWRMMHVWGFTPYLVALEASRTTE